MDTSDLKTKLHESIENIDDPDILLAIKEISERKYTPALQPFLTDYNIHRLEKSKKQIQDGNFLTNDQANNLIDKWLKE